MLVVIIRRVSLLRMINLFLVYAPTAAIRCWLSEKQEMEFGNVVFEKSVPTSLNHYNAHVF